MWSSRLLLVLLSLVTPGGATVAPAGDEPKPTGIPKGEVTKYTFASSQIFPGTVRDYWVYVPQQYDPAKPACVYVNQDGIQYNAPAVFDQLIHQKEMPVTIGIFVQPGRVKATSDQALDRFNRSYEYDGLGDSYARFLLEELLPDVEKKTTKDGRPLRLSKDGNDRCIGGASSGAICAFTTAWERPDAFRRVFSAIGTYVGLRGGHNYPTLIRKTEPKPLRVFLQDGSNDLNIYGGDWWMANQEMERALRFAGYEVNHSWGTGGHNTQDATKIFPDAMRWLWKDWPAPIKLGAGSPQLQEILQPGEGWQLVGEGYTHAYGLTANAQGEVFFDDVPNRKAFKIGVDGTISFHHAVTREILEQTFGPDGKLYALARDSQQLLMYDATGKAALFVEGVSGYGLTVRHDGSLFVSQSGDKERTSKICLISPQGKKRLVEISIPTPHGVALSPDQSLLYVTDRFSHWVYSFQITQDGRLAHEQRYVHLHVPDTADDSGACGLQTDRDGRLYVNTRMGLQVADQTGRVNGIIPAPGLDISSFCFGGPNFDTLWAACHDKIYRRKLRVQGVNPAAPPLKPKPPRL